MPFSFGRQSMVPRSVGAGSAPVLATLESDAIALLVPCVPGQGAVARRITISSGTSANLQNLTMSGVSYVSGSGWLALELEAQADGTFFITCTVDPDAMVVDGESATFTVAASTYGASAAGSPLTITVTGALSAPTPVFTLSRSALSFVLDDETVGTAQTITITKVGSGSMGTPTAGAVSYGAGATGWATCGITGTGPWTLTVTPSAVGGTPGGPYTATVAISATSAGNSPQTVSLDMSVTSATVPTTTIPAQLHLFGSTAGTVTVVGGWPLRPGDLTPADVTAKKFAVWIGGAEQSIYCEAMPGLHPDGTVRAVLYQLSASIPSSTPVDAEVRLGTVRATIDRLETTMTPALCFVAQAPGVWGVESEPTAKLLPNSVAYACATDLTFQPLVPASQETATEAGRMQALFSARVASLEVETDNKLTSTISLYQSTYESGRALIAAYARTGTADYVREALKQSWKLLEYVFPSPSYNGWSPNPNAYGETRFTTSANSGWLEQYRLKLLSFGSCWQLSGYLPFFTRVNIEHQNYSTTTRATLAGATSLVGGTGYIEQFYGIRANITKMWPHVVAYMIGANRRTSTPSGNGNRDMAFPVELPLIIEALLARPWNVLGDWRNGVYGLNHGNNDGSRNSAPKANDFPTFQLALVNSFLLCYEREVLGDSRIPAMVKANTIAVLLNTRALTINDNTNGAGATIASGYPVATWGTPYWMTTVPASQGGGGDASSFTLAMHVDALAYCAAKWPTDVVNGATFSTWYDRAMDAANNANHAQVQSYDWGYWNRGWKILGEVYGYTQQAMAIRVNGVATGPASIQSLTVPTTWPG